MTWNEILHFGAGIAWGMIVMPWLLLALRGLVSLFDYRERHQR